MKLYEKILNLKEQEILYTVDFYLQVGQHGNAFQGSDLRKAKSIAKRLTNDAKKDDDIRMVEISNHSSEGDFDGIIYYMTEDYLNDVMDAQFFKDNKAYNNYKKAAKQNMKTKKPVEWTI